MKRISLERKTVAPAKSGAGIDLLKSFTDDTWRGLRFFVYSLEAAYSDYPHSNSCVTAHSFPFLSIQPPISPFWQAIVKTWLARLLLQRTLSLEMEPILAGLVFDVVVYFAEKLRAPHWVRTAEGVKCIEEVDGVQES
ncbi:hypothetical protein SJI19_06800 [Acerihabitans sp. TG2]|uniref:hypothetical protein n=1 Tax=Acerihabitans sp. TG2 TaxID=3096008 RepID=UPI002B22E77B|nr:hypothetical protein [Acerihabitans sp. TG2]MEA9390260.1 hypothetical protein [Acerihabitans sp. TG2]